MSTRIKYKFTRPDTNAYYVSTQFYEGTTSSYEVHLDVMNMTFQILHAGTENIALHGTASNLNALKSKAKKALTSLGVAFSNESRAKRSLAEVAA